MEYLCLIASVVCMATSSVFGTYYNRKNEGRENIAVFYNFLLMTAAFVFKEKLVWQQWLGVTLGAIAVAVLSL